MLGALLPATANPDADLDVFEKLMAMDPAGFGRRIALSKNTKLKPTQVAAALLAQGWTEGQLAEVFGTLGGDAIISAVERGTIRWARHVDWELKATLYPAALAMLPFMSPDEKKPELGWLGLADRAEQVDQDKLYAPIWPEVNGRLGTSANSIPTLVEQLGAARFGNRPVVGDAFCGGGSIPFEAARLGCDVVASDLNPIACMLTWGALNIVGADAATRVRIEEAQKLISTTVDAKITQLGIEHNARGDRAKAYLYCVETRCPETGYMVPMLPNRIISRSRRAIVVLEPDRPKKRFHVRVRSDASNAEMEAAEMGTVAGGDLVVTLDGVTHRTPIRTLRGDRRGSSGETANNLRQWEVHDFVPRPEDVWQERLYAIQWITKETLGASRQDTYFAEVSADDEDRERKVEEIVRNNLVQWQLSGLVPDMAIEAGHNTRQPIWERGWTHWHHLFGARNLHLLAIAGEAALELNGTARASTEIGRSKAYDWLNRCCYYGTGAARESISHLFYNQAFNTFWNYGIRPSIGFLELLQERYEAAPIAGSSSILSLPASNLHARSDIWITDPPYADAVRYEEITEFFIAWLRKNPPEPFRDWVWDSRRALAIKGSGDDFKTEMIAAYRNLANNMPDNGMQIVMFTHQNSEIWADMAAIMWGSGLQVSAAWYIATETTSELKKGGYVQGTVLLALRKRTDSEGGYRDEITQEISAEVARQIENLTGLNDRTKDQGRSENLFEDADLQMAGYAAALRVLTRYARIDGDDMAAYASRPRVRGRADPVKEIIDFAVETANAHLVPGGLGRDVWSQLSAEERFYLKLVELEALSLKKLDNYQNFGKAFRADWQPLMANLQPNAARLKTAMEFGRAQFGDGFGETPTRRILWAMLKLQAAEVNSKAILEELRTTPRYFDRRDAMIAIARYLREKRTDVEGEVAGILADLIENERLA